MGLRFVITGCARSGTAYVAKVLATAGSRCAHERVFCYDGPPEDPHGAADRCGVAGESSWMAAPHVAGIPGTRIFHQVRDPRLWCYSFATQRRDGPYYDYMLGHAGDELHELPYGEYAARHWLRWNGLVERRADAVRYRLDDVADVLREHVDLFEIERGDLEEALSAIPKNYNSVLHGMDGEPFAGATEQTLAELWDAAARYGF